MDPWSGIPRPPDNNQELINFCQTLEQVCIETVESGKMTKDRLFVSTVTKWNMASTSCTRKNSWKSWTKH
ncbi:hypothetical protein MKQ70_19230 [Chitinophaga sedimenti]|uniref:hypothetical protein n=1 Tax=Chitinophaga sedimenti TaxID=2033606 RepID=UPI0020062891|nr:hypothetical protein [Chitinophaga sedimenti]